MSEIKIKVKLDGKEALLGIGEINSKLDDFSEKVQKVDENSDEFKELTENINNLKKAISEMKVNLDTSESLKELEELEKRIDDISGQINVDVNAVVTGTEVISELQDSVIDIKTQVDDSSIKEVIELSDKEVNLDINLDQGAIDKLNSLEGKSLKVEVDIEDSGIQMVQNDLNDLENKTIEVNTEVDDSQIIDLNTQLDDLEGKNIEVNTTVDIDTDNLDDFTEKINETVVKPTVDSSPIDQLEDSIDEVNDTTIEPQVDSSSSAELSDLTDNLDKAKESAEDLDNTEINPQVSDEPVEAIEKTTTSVGKLKRELVSLTAQLENAEVGSDTYRQLEGQVASVSLQLAQAKDRVDDLTDALSTQVGPPVERASRSFQLLGDGVKNFDVEKINIALRGFASTIKDSVLKPAGDFGKSIGQIGKSILTLDFNGLKNGLSGVSTGFKTLGKAVISTGIGALVVGVTSLIANFDELKESGGVVGKVFTAIGDSVTALTDKFRPLLSFLGLAQSEAEIKADKIAGANDKEIEAIELRYDREIELAKASGKETESIEKKKFQSFIDITQAEINQLLTLAGGYDNLSKAQKERFDQLFANLGKYSHAIKVIDATENSEDNQNKINDDAEKAGDKRQKYKDDISKLQDQYINDETTKINKMYDDELKKIKGNSLEEQALREAIDAKRLVDIAKFNEKRLADERKVEQELAELRVQNEGDDNAKLAATEAERIQIESQTEEKLYQIRLEFLEREKTAALTAIGVTDKEKELIEQRYTSKFKQLADDRSQKVKQSQERQTQIVTEELDKQLNALLADREELLNGDTSGIGLSGKLDALEENFRKEKDLLEKQREALLKAQQDIIDSTKEGSVESNNAKQEQARINAEVNAKIEENDRASAEIRRQLIAEEVSDRLNQVSEIVNIAQSALSVRQEEEAAQLAMEQESLESEYEKRKKAIEDNIKDEQTRANALRDLDNEISGRRDALARKALEQKKKEIKQQRNAAVATIALGLASTLANAAASVKGVTPIDFAIQLAAAAASAYAAIRKARTALREADQAASSIGAGGGGGEGGSESAPAAPPTSTPVPTPASQSGNQVPQAFSPVGQNDFATGEALQQQNGLIINPVVSVIEIEAAMNSNSVSVSESTFG